MSGQEGAASGAADADTERLWEAFRVGFAASGEGWNGEIAQDRGWDLAVVLAPSFEKFRYRVALRGSAGEGST